MNGWVLSSFTPLRIVSSLSDIRKDANCLAEVRVSYEKLTILVTCQFPLWAPDGNALSTVARKKEERICCQDAPAGRGSRPCNEGMDPESITAFIVRAPDNIERQSELHRISRKARPRPGIFAGLQSMVGRHCRSIIGLRIPGALSQLHRTPVQLPASDLRPYRFPFLFLLHAEIRLHP